MAKKEKEANEVDAVTWRKFLRGGAAGLATAAMGNAFANTMNPTQSPFEVNPAGRFAEKVVIVTGATYGIDETTARAFAAEGATVHFCGRSEDLGV